MRGDVFSFSWRIGMHFKWGKCPISECRQSYLSDYPCQNQKVTFQVWNWESNESLYSSKNDRITLFLELYEKNSPESSKKCARWCFFGTMREKNVLSVPKSLRIAFFWNYEGKNVLSVPKKPANCYFLGLCEQYLSGQFQSKQYGRDFVYSLKRISGHPLLRTTYELFLFTSCSD